MDGPPSLAHLRWLTDETGLIQHTWRRVRDRRHGYTLDDNTRALAVAIGVQRLGADSADLVDRYLEFVHSAQLPDGRFHNVLSYDRRWLDEVGTEDAHGHAVAALGYAAACAPEAAVRTAAELLAVEALAHLEELTHLRSIAHSLIGLCWLRSAGRPARPGLLEQLAARLVSFYDAHADEDWAWFEPVVTYDNGRLPLALLLAFAATGDPRYEQVARESLEFLVRQVYPEQGALDIIGNAGWLWRGGPRAIWDQQPVDAASMAEVAAAAAQTIGPAQHYDALSRTALEWFEGRNRHQTQVYVATTGACYDGLTVEGVNENLGAESVLALFQAWLAVTDPRWTVPAGP